MYLFFSFAAFAFGMSIVRLTGSFIVGRWTTEEEKMYMPKHQSKFKFYISHPHFDMFLGKKERKGRKEGREKERQMEGGGGRKGRKMEGRKERGKKGRKGGGRERRKEGREGRKAGGREGGECSSHRHCKRLSHANRIIYCLQLCGSRTQTDPSKNGSSLLCNA
jgi:hypothetical protein